MIIAADSDQEKSSEKGSKNSSNENTAEKKEEPEDSYDESEEENNRASAMNERNNFKKNLQVKELVRKEENDLYGKRLSKKIDDFIFSVSVEAGLTDTNIEEFKNYGNVQNQEML